MGNSTLILQIGLIIVVMFVFMIMPAQKKAKQEKEFEAQLKVGDRVITKGGLHGKLVELGETTIVLETMSGKLKMERSSLSREMTIAMNKKEEKK